MKILLAQLNPIIGDLEGNTELILQAIQNGRTKSAQIVLFPELTITGYPPEDFLLLPNFIKSVETKLEEIIKASEGLTVIVGLPRHNPDQKQKHLFNSAAVIHDCQLLGYQDKILLPTYDVFDELRYFEPGHQMKIWEIQGKRIAITICEDLWQHSGIVQSTCYLRDPVEELENLKPDMVLNLSASPFSVNKFNNRLQVCKKASTTLNCPLILCNQVGGNDSLIFDGFSLFVNTQGLIELAKGFESDELLIDTEMNQAISEVKEDEMQQLYQALVLGIRDYFRKAGFQKACLGLSGGVDSALAACLAVEALGSNNVLALGMPSRYTSPEGVRDAISLAKKLNIEYQEISIEGPFKSYLELLTPYFSGRSADTTEENIQARIRGMILMAFSNKFGYIVISTGNKSEMALGYSTLYGDMCGGLGVISDLTKQQVYALAKWINRKKEIIPYYTIEREPSAELRPNQKDVDTLPPYEIIDKVLQAYVEEHCSEEEIIKRFGYSPMVVHSLVKRIHQNEYKRRQAPPGLRISEKAFSVGRHFPIVQKWR